jgi:hypothetical protein
LYGRSEIFIITAETNSMAEKKMTKKIPEIPSPEKQPEENPKIVPDEPAIPEEDPDTIPGEPSVTPSPFEIPQPEKE